MFGLKSVAHVGEYFQNLQKYEPEEEGGIVNIEDTTTKNSRPFSSIEASFNSERRHSMKLDIEPEVEGSAVVKERFLKSNFSGFFNAKTLSAKASTSQERGKIWFTEAVNFGENRRISSRNSFLLSVSPGECKYSCDTLPTLNTDQNSQTHQFPPLSIQQLKIHRQPEPASGREQLSLLKSSNSAYKNAYCNNSSQERPARSNSGREYTSTPLLRRKELVGCLTPLRESAGNSNESHSFETILPVIVIEKTRRSSEGNLIAAQKQARTSSRLPKSNRSTSLFLSSKSNLHGSHVPYPYCLGRYETPKSQELRSTDRYACLLQGRQTTRSSSTGALRHLPLDPEARLHIGTQNRNISFASSSGQSRFDLSVSYRLPKRDDRVAPTMAPNFVVGPYLEHRKNPNSIETVDSIRQGPFDIVSGTAIGREVNETGRPPMNSSSMANAGSQESDGAVVDELSGLGEGLIAPSSSPSGEMTEFCEGQDILRRNYEQGAGKDNVTNAFDIEELFHNLEKFSVSTDVAKLNGARPSFRGTEECKASFSPLEDTASLGAVDPDRNKARNLGSSFYPIIPNLGESLLRAPDDQGDVCSKYSETIALPRSASSPNILSRPQRSISFAENCNSVASGRTSQRSRGSVSWADPANESPIICSHLRGPNFSTEFEESMMTLPFPPVEHMVPVRSRQGSTPSVSPSIILSEKPRGMWSQVKKMITGCYSVC